MATTLLNANSLTCPGVAPCTLHATQPGGRLDLVSHFAQVQAGTMHMATTGPLGRMTLNGAEETNNAATVVARLATGRAKLLFRRHHYSRIHKGNTSVHLGGARRSIVRRDTNRHSSHLAGCLGSRPR